jgi:O-antigen/teichoic acid export membrane protein
MEPRHSMTAYAVCVAAAICLLAAKGLQAVVFAAAIGVIVAGATLSAIYRHWRAGRNAPAHRATLDRLVLGQWLGAGAVGAAAAVTLATTDTAPLRGADVVWNALIVAFAVW